MKKSLLILAAALLGLVSCRSIILEERDGCPSFLFFRIDNESAFQLYERIHVGLFRYPEENLMAADTTSVSEIAGRSFYFDIRNTPAVEGYGLLGYRHCVNESGTLWRVPVGAQYDSLFRFSYRVPVERESFTVPVEFTKEHVKVTLRFIGADPLDSGEIFINGKQVTIKEPKDAIENGIGMVTEDRRFSGSIYALSVMANTTLAAFDSLCNSAGFYSPKTEEKAFNNAVKQIAVKYSNPKEKISQLSGGNQQKVIIARWLMAHPKVLILDEPTRGIDIGSKSEIYKIMSELAQQGMAIIMVSSELPEILGASDRIMVVSEGRIVHECLRENATQESLISYAFGTEK